MRLRWPRWKMGKKKIKEAEEPQAGDGCDVGKQCCPHIAKAVRPAKLAKLLPHLAAVCADCHPRLAKSTVSKKQKKLSSAAVATGTAVPPEKGLCVCLKCGRVACDRLSLCRHALLHHRRERHAVTCHLSTLTVWCYDCDDGIPWGQSADVDRCLVAVRAFAQRHSVADGDADGSNSAYSNDRDDPDNLSQESTAIDPLHHQCTQEDRVSHLAERSSGGCGALTGLANLGNTCFFNSVMQCIARTAPLQSAVAHNMAATGTIVTLPSCRLPPMPVDEKGITRTSPGAAACYSDGNVDAGVEVLPALTLSLTTLPEQQYTTAALHEFLQAMCPPTNRGPHVLRPKELLEAICGAAPRFRGYGQHDAQELLRSLLEQLEKEQKLRLRDALIERYAPQTGFMQLPASTQHKVRTYFNNASYYTDSVFGGRLSSTVICKTCSTPSRTIDSFLDLSLSLETHPASSTSLSRQWGAKSTTACGAKPAHKANKSQQSRKNGISSPTQHTTKDSQFNSKAQVCTDEVGDDDTYALNTVTDRTSQSTAADPELLTHSRMASDANSVFSSSGDVISNASSEDDSSRESKLASTDTTPSPSVSPVLLTGAAAPPYKPKPGEMSVQACLARFCEPEVLSGGDIFACERCAIKRPASKQFLIEGPPRILTLHLKRFEQTGYRLEKVSKHVSFPLVLDLAPFCGKACSPGPDPMGFIPGLEYGLYGVVVHQGRLHSGHYTCFVKEKDAWYYISDSHVAKVKY